MVVRARSQHQRTVSHNTGLSPPTPQIIFQDPSEHLIHSRTLDRHVLIVVLHE